jgi:hypothetical protein
MTKQKPISHLPQSKLAESLGWIGAAGLLGSYALLSLGIINGDSIIYHTMLLAGSAGLAVITYRHQAYQSFMVNVVFSLLACVAIFRILFLA